VTAIQAPLTAGLTVVCGHEEHTRRLGESCGRDIRDPVVLFLIGDLGSGKTVFVQGLARGLDVPETDYVTSPSFTLINEYPGRLRLYHIDLYRLESNLDPDDLGLTEILKGDDVAAVEWADKLPSGLQPDRLEVRFEIGEGDHRTLRFFAYGQVASSLLSKLTLLTDGHRPTHGRD
jgi:tRNA threonylcarbamoyladenosine biosynthesis protein TsaE